VKGYKNIINIPLSLIVIFLSFSVVSLSQNSANNDLKFIDHLVNIGDFDEALYLLDSTDYKPDTLNDSINYLRGWSLYSLKRLKASSESLGKVTSASVFFLKSHFFEAYNYSHIGDYNTALQSFSEIPVNTEKLISLKNYEIAGIYLLQGNREMFEKLLIKTDKSFYEISDSYDKIQKISLDLKNHKIKSPVLAGFLSGIIPGSGKFYAGKKGEAISAFFATTGLGVVTWENYRKSGLKSFKTIAFGTAFAFSYVANIYGSVLTINLLESEYNENVKNTILFNLHIPLRNIFDK
jgi:hypothetical protein